MLKFRSCSAASGVKLGPPSTCLHTLISTRRSSSFCFLVQVRIDDAYNASDRTRTFSQSLFPIIILLQEHAIMMNEKFAIFLLALFFFFCAEWSSSFVAHGYTQILQLLYHFKSFQLYSCWSSIAEDHSLTLYCVHFQSTLRAELIITFSDCSACFCWLPSTVDHQQRKELACKKLHLYTLVCFPAHLL